MTDLLTAFDQLPLPAATGQGGGFSGAALSGTSHHVAKDGEGRPVVLLTVTATGVRPPSLLLRNLRVEHGVRCRISRVGGEVIDGSFSLVQCRSTDVFLQRCFLELFDTVVTALPATPTSDDIAAAIERMAALFQALERPPTRAVQGLWGELFVIVRSTDRLAMAIAWHNESCDRYDFAAGLQRLEVKTSSNRTRCHRLSLPQAHPPEGVQVVILSMHVEQSAAGRSLGSLWDAARVAVSADAELRLKIDEQCLAALGTTWQDARRLAFDEQLALSSLQFYDVRDIPRVPLQLPEGVSDVRFQSDVAFGTTVRDAGRPTAPLVDLLIVK